MKLGQQPQLLPQAKKGGPNYYPNQTRNANLMGAYISFYRRFLQMKLGQQPQLEIPMLPYIKNT